MSRRPSLPGADELFRSTGPTVRTSEPTLRSVDAPTRSTPAAGEPERTDQGAEIAAAAPADLTEDLGDHRPRPAARQARRAVDRRPTGRERHDEKITVYCSADELIDLEHARLTLRRDFGLAIDRGRIVREAMAVVLADLEAKGESSILVRRLSGR